MEGTPQERTREVFEQGAFEENEEDEKPDSRGELKENEKELTERERAMAEPTGTESIHPLQGDLADEKGFRETGTPPQLGEEPVEERALQEIYEVAGYDADSEGFLEYPTALTGDIIDIELEDGSIAISYRIEQDASGKLRGPGFFGEEELGTRLTPAENVAIDVETDDEYVEIDLFYDREDLVEGSREAAEKLGEVEDYLSV